MLPTQSIRLTLAMCERPMRLLVELAEKIQPCLLVSTPIAIDAAATASLQMLRSGLVIGSSPQIKSFSMIGCLPLWTTSPIGLRG